MRIVVVEPPPQGSPRLSRSPLRVGAFDWFDPEPVCTVVVKLTYALGAGELSLTPEQMPLSTVDRLSDRAGLEGEVSVPWDFAPHKPAADILVTGNVYADSPKPRNELLAGFAVGPLERSFQAIASAPSPQIPLGPRFLGGERVGPAPIAEELMLRRSHEEEFDYSIYNAAPSSQRRDYLAPGEEVRLMGLSPHSEVAFLLPSKSPRVLVSWKGPIPDSEIQMVADTLWIDTEKESCVLVYRGMIATPRPSSVERLCVALEPSGPDEEPRSWDEILRSAARGSFTISADQDELSSEPGSDEELDRIAAARFDFATRALPPEPTISLATYAAVSAELAEQRETRELTLARHGLDENTWMLEERAWLEAMAERSMKGDGTLAVEFGENFVAAQDKLAEPHELERTLEDYAELFALLEVVEDPPKELERRKIRLAEWLRLDRRIRRAADEDASVAAELERLLDEARRRVGEEMDS